MGLMVTGRTALRAGEPYLEDHFPIRLAHIAHGHRHMTWTNVNHRAAVAHSRVEDQQVGPKPDATRILCAERAWCGLCMRVMLALELYGHLRGPKASSGLVVDEIRHRLVAVRQATLGQPQSN